jgi:hypothetical protein
VEDVAPGKKDEGPNSLLENIDTDKRLTIDEGFKRTRDLMYAAVEAASKNVLSVIVIDSPPGTRKTTTWGQMGIKDAQDGRNRALFVPRYRIMDEVAIRGAHSLGRDRPLTEEPPYHVPVEGARRVCKYREFLDELLKCSRTTVEELCAACFDRATCAYARQFKLANRPGSFILSTHQLIGKTLKKIHHEGPVWLDELPQFTETVEVTIDDIAAYADQSAPSELQGLANRDNYPLHSYLLPRQAASVAYAILLGKVASLPWRPWRQLVYGEDLRRLCNEKAFRQAVSYDPKAGDHPVHQPESGPPPSAALSREFDGLRRPFLNLLHGRENLNDGVVAAYKDPNGSCGFSVMHRNPILPSLRGAVITAGATAQLKPYIEAVLSNRRVDIHVVKVLDSEHVTKLGVDTGALTARPLATPTRRRKAARRLLLQLLPTVVQWAAEHDKETVKLGLACRKALRLDFEDDKNPKKRPAEELREVIEVYRACGIELVGVEHYGNLDGSNKFEEVDVWLRLGDHRPNRGAIQFLAYCLEKSGASLTPDVLEAAWISYYDIQDSGRARPKQRTSATALLDIKCGREPTGCEEVLSFANRPPPLTSLLYELTAFLLLTYSGQCSVPMMKRFLSEVGDGGQLSGWGCACMGRRRALRIPPPRPPGDPWTHEEGPPPPGAALKALAGRRGSLSGNWLPFWAWPNPGERRPLSAQGS